MRVECRFGAAFDLHRRTNVAVPRPGCRWVRKQQTLTIWIVGVNGDGGIVRLDVLGGESFVCNFAKLPGKHVLDVPAASVLDCIESRLALLAAYCLKLRHGCSLPNPRSSRKTVISMSSEKSGNQALGFRE